MCEVRHSHARPNAMGELEKYLNENPELLETADEEMDMVEGDEFGDPEG